MEYAVFHRADEDFWQAIAGGGEDGETPEEAARRETAEEAGIPPTARLVRLDSMATIPVPGICGELAWGPGVLVVPEHAFGVDAAGVNIVLSREHTEYRWLEYGPAREILKWDSNRNALWELDHRLSRPAKPI